MLTLARPTPEKIRTWIALQAPKPFSYEAVGATAEPERLAERLPAEAVVDRHRVQIGSTEGDYQRAVAAVRRWEMFRLGWAELCWPSAPIARGTTVAVLMRGFGVWALNACRIVYGIDESGGAVDRFGFAYGTLRGHALRGEERFCVEWQRDDDSVWYELLRFARPAPGFPRLVRPLVRGLQLRFARDSLRAMEAATRR